MRGKTKNDICKISVTCRGPSVPSVHTTLFQLPIYCTPLKPGQCEGGNLLQALFKGASLGTWVQSILHTPFSNVSGKRGAEDAAKRFSH